MSYKKDICTDSIFIYQIVSLYARFYGWRNLMQKKLNVFLFKFIFIALITNLERMRIYGGSGSYYTFFVWLFFL